MNMGMDYHQLLTQENLPSAQSTNPLDTWHAGFTGLAGIAKKCCWTTSLNDGKLTTTGLQYGKCGLDDAWS